MLSAVILPLPFATDPPDPTLNASGAAEFDARVHPLAEMSVLLPTATEATSARTQGGEPASTTAATARARTVFVESLKPAALSSHEVEGRSTVTETRLVPASGTTVTVVLPLPFTNPFRDATP